MSSFRKITVEDKRTTIKDIVDTGAILSFGYFNRDYQNIISSRYVFKLGKLTAQIRVTCYGNAWAVDVTDPDAYFDSGECLGTNFTANEAKRVVVDWFNKNKFHAWHSKRKPWSTQPYQVPLFPTLK